MTKNKLIQLIHVAKRELALDDDTYRAMLQGAVNKTSCKAMSLSELMIVLQLFKDKGFKVVRRSMPSMAPRHTVHPEHKTGRMTARPNLAGIQSKIRAVWATMAEQGIVHNNTDKALDAYINRMLKQRANNAATSLRWLNDQQAVQVLEALKKWQQRSQQGSQA